MPSSPLPDADLTTEFAGQRGRLFWLALRTSILTVLTLGLYRFWMKTRMRRYYWSSIRPGGVPLEYVGEPLEKLLGFLIAVVLMSFYIGIVNLVLMFASFALFHGNTYAYVISFIGVIPILFFAQYRARRYVLARTRWRGIRFGVDNAAWGYAVRALWWWFLTIISLGILWPRKTFALEKYRTDRTWFGSVRLHQGGHPWMLMNACKHFWIGILLTAIGTAGAYGMTDPASALGFGLLAVLGIGWTLFGLAYWQVDSFRRLTSTKSLGGLRLTARPRPWRILRHYVLGYGLTLLAVCVLAMPFIAALIATNTDPTNLFDPLPGAEAAKLRGWLLGAAGVLAYFLVFIFWGVFRQVFVGLPNMRHYAETLVLQQPLALNAVTQRARDEFAEAEGFADALDLGAAI
ncbi:YjgN family protein [Frigidibacter sp. ROC022]|uniref:YjgN family protein n=1 Tax=Frigidibacter sp. ROC022 TaxID=2971796 RepID=UPI00215B6592|nr:YjgN family protein [Frigidibacter sp. ROC022]MCR8726518.1 YjgN family protein [Frigidibacter sp. ROC022]